MSCSRDLKSSASSGGPDYEISSRWDNGESHYNKIMIHSLSVKQLTDYLKVWTELLYDISNNTENFYKIYSFSKNGRLIIIEAPIPILEYI